MRNSAARLIWALTYVWVPLGAADIDGKIDFARDVQPVLRERCVSCHGPSQQMAGLRLDRRRSAMDARGRTLIGPGNAAGSLLYFRLTGSKYGPQMPPTGPLPPEQIAAIRSWIDQGAVWPDEFSGDEPGSKPDPRATALNNALRKGDRISLRRLLRKDPSAVNAKGAGGSTPLMYAMLYADADAVRQLLAAGADPNIRNDAGAAALMWAVDDAEKTRLLLAHKADPNAISDEKRSPLAIAVASKAPIEVFALLLKAGAKTTAKSAGEPPPTSGAGGREDLLRLLLDHGVDRTRLSAELPTAISSDCPACVELLLPSARKQILNGAMIAATFQSDVHTLKRVLTLGANPSFAMPGLAFTPLMAATVLDTRAAETVETLIANGANVNARTTDGATPLDFAMGARDPAVLELLRKAGATSGADTRTLPPKGTPAASAREAVLRGIPLLQRSDVTFLKKSGCVSCHNNTLTALTVAAAQKKGVPVDDGVMRKQLELTAAYLEANRERALQGLGIPGDADTIGYALLGLAEHGYAPNAATDAMARYLKNTQRSDGSWANAGGRPPMEMSDIQTTAVALRVLQVYAPRPHRKMYDKVVERGAKWLANAMANTNEDRTFRLLGLIWTGATKELIRTAANDLLSRQQSDGGWSQIPTLPSDAYATGQALFALAEAGRGRADTPAYRRGAEFLKNTQLADGSWYVRSRSIPFQPYFESEFPHGPDQFISAAATNWATIALLRTLP